MALVLHSSARTQREQEERDHAEGNRRLPSDPDHGAGDSNTLSNTHDSRSPYPSPPLAPDEIRLLHILPGTGIDRIECELQTVAFTHDCQYDALSYTWGESNERRTIQLATVTDFAVTDNAYAALMRFRQPDHAKTIWIDAICINQKDPKERARQVAIMGQIYRRAACVLVWLGDNGSTAFRGFHGIDAEVQGAMDALLFQRPRWWERAWIVQEVAHAKKVDVYFGRFCKPWPDFCWDVFALSVGGRSNFATVRECVEWSRTQRWDQSKFHQRVVERFNTIDSVRTYTRPAAEGQNRRSTLASLATWTRYQECRDPRDRVYSVASLLDPGEAALIQIDYSEENYWWKVYARSTLASIVAQSSFDIMRLCRFDHPSVWLPTWMVRFGHISADGVGTLFSPQYEVRWPGRKKEWESVASLSQDARTLSLAGCFFDTVAAVDSHAGTHADGPAVVSSSRSSLSTALESLAVLLETVLMAAKAHSPYSRIGRNHTTPQCTQNVCALDDFPEPALSWARKIRQQRSGRPKVTDAIAAAMQCWELVTGIREHTNNWTDDVRYLVDISNAWSYASSVESGVNVFTTTAGFIGIACGTVGKGDLLVCVPGATLPMVLRTCPYDAGYYSVDFSCMGHPDHPTAEHFRFRGFAYVHGIANGELLRMCKKEDFCDDVFRLV